MNRTKRVAAIGLLCVGASSLSFGETFTSIGSGDWDTTYTSSTALFSAVVEQGGAGLQAGFPGTPAVTAGTALTNNAQDTFTLTYAPDSGLASLIVTDANNTILDSLANVSTNTVAQAGGTLDHIGIALSVGSNETITVSGIQLNGADAGSLGLNQGPGLFDFAMTPPSDLSGNQLVTLTGNIDMSWTGNATGSDLSAEIVGADSVTVSPEPGTWALLGSALAGLGFLRRKRIV